MDQSLNAGLDDDEDLEATVATTTFVAAQPYPDKNAGGNEPSPKALFGDNVKEGEVPELDAEFVILDEGVDRFYDIHEIKHRLGESNGIAKEDAQDINELIPGFISSRQPLAYFSQEKSRTQFKPAMEELNVALDGQLSALITSAKALATGIQNAGDVYAKSLDGRFNEAYTAVNNATALLLQRYGLQGVSGMSYVFADGSKASSLFLERTEQLSFSGDESKHIHPAIAQSLDTMAGVVKTYGSRQNLKYFLNTSIPFKPVIAVGNDHYTLEKETWVLMDPKEVASIGSRGSNDIVLEAVVRRLAGACGVQIVSDLRCGVSGLVRVANSVQDSLNGLSENVEIPLDAKCKEVAKLSGSLKTSYVLLTAISCLIEDILVFVTETTKILQVIAELEKKEGN